MLIGIIDLLATTVLLAAGAAFIVLQRRKRLPRSAVIVVSLLLGWTIVRSAGNALAWLGISQELEALEDQLGVMEPVLWGGFFFALSMAIKNRERARVEADLRESQARLQHQLSEKNVLLREIHHRVRNNLNVIVSMLNLQLDQQAADAPERSALMEAQARIFTMARVHELLYANADLSAVRLDRLAREIAAHPLRAGQVSRRFRVSSPELAVEIDQALPLALIINELVELADGERESPQLHLECLRGMVVIEATGLNLRSQDRLHCPIISALAAQLEGEALIPPEHPTSVTVRVPRRTSMRSENLAVPQPPADDLQLGEDRIS